MTINKKLVPDGMKNNPNKQLKELKYITIHTTGNRNTTATAKMHVDYQFSGSGGSETSWHYTVDDKEIWQSFDDLRMCWHAGNAEGNATSIGIEICVNNKNGFAKACDNAAQLVSELLQKYKLEVVQHNFWSGKDCPHELRTGEWGGYMLSARQRQRRRK
jgi:N-acetylmuramoyl-L-alanine amidase